LQTYMMRNKKAHTLERMLVLRRFLLDVMKLSI
jgi:hypothetical protein